MPGFRDLVAVSAGDEARLGATNKALRLAEEWENAEYPSIAGTIPHASLFCVWCRRSDG
jgi:hypothetical protein